MKKFAVSPYAFRLLDPRIEVLITSPLIDSFIQNFLMGTFEQKEIVIALNGIKASLIIQSLEILPQPQLSDKEQFLLLSPMVISKRRANPDLPAYYLRTDDIEEARKIFETNLIRKYGIVHNRPYEGSGVSFSWNERYLSQHQRVTKKIRIETIPAIDIIGVQAPFTVEGDPELIAIGYNCGFGEKNSIGFGMAEFMQ